MNTMPTPAVLLYESAEVAELTGLEPGTIAKYVKRGTLKPVKRIGRNYLFDQSEIDRFQRERKKAGNPNFGKQKPKKKRE